MGAKTLITTIFLNKQANFNNQITYFLDKLIIFRFFINYQANTIKNITIKAELMQIIYKLQ